MPIYLIRHTQPLRHKGICYGQTDLPVAPSFDTEAEAIRQVLPEHFQTVFSSPLQRCTQLAARLFPDQEARTLQQLKELDFGTWEMKYWHDLPRSETDAWAIDFVNNAPPLGECFSELHERVTEVWNTHIVKHVAANTAVIAHAGVIRAILVQLLGMPLRKAFAIGVEYGAVVRIDKVGKSDYTIHFLK